MTLFETTKSVRRRGLMSGFGACKTNVGILALLGLQLLSHHVVLSAATASSLFYHDEILEYPRRRLQDIENITIAGSADLKKIFALAQAKAAQDTSKPMTLKPSLPPAALKTPAPQSTTTAPLQAPIANVKPTKPKPSAAPALVASLSPTKALASRPTLFPVQLLHPSTSAPTQSPKSSQGGSAPPVAALQTNSPTKATAKPTNAPTHAPVISSSTAPIKPPSHSPSQKLSQTPSDMPSYAPSGMPSNIPSVLTIDSKPPSARPSTVPVPSPSILPIQGSKPSFLQSDVPSLAPSSNPSALTVVTGNSTAFSASSSILSCSKVAGKNFIVLPYIYSMETDVQYEVSAVRLSLEQILNIDMAPMLLDCSATRRRYLSSGSGIIGIDWHPIDVQSTTLTCKPESANDVCNVFLGKMTLYILNNTRFSNVADEARSAIQNVFRVIVVAGLVKVTYLGSDLLSAAAALQGTNSTGSLNQVVSNGSLGPSAIILFTTGSAAFVAAMGVFWYLRQKRAERSEVSGAATEAAGTDTTGADYYNARRPTSPFSEMLPNAYRFDHDMNMSAILETDEESQARSELLVSEGWVSDNDTSCSIDVPSANYSRITATPVLGARKRQDVPAEPFELCSL